MEEFVAKACNVRKIPLFDFDFGLRLFTAISRKEHKGSKEVGDILCSAENDIMMTTSRALPLDLSRWIGDQKQA